MRFGIKIVEHTVGEQVLVRLRFLIYNKRMLDNKRELFRWGPVPGDDAILVSTQTAICVHMM